MLIGLQVSCSRYTNKPGTDGGTPSPAYYMKTKLDGTTVNFSGSVKAMRGVDDGIHIVQIQGIKTCFTGEVDLVINSAQDVTAGDYIQGRHETYIALGVYAPQSRTMTIVSFSQAFSPMLQHRSRSKLPG